MIFLPHSEQKSRIDANQPPEILNLKILAKLFQLFLDFRAGNLDPHSSYSGRNIILCHT